MMGIWCTSTSWETERFTSGATQSWRKFGHTIGATSTWNCNKTTAVGPVVGNYGRRNLDHLCWGLRAMTGSLFKAWSRSEYNTAFFAGCQHLCSCLPSGFIRLRFFQNFSPHLPTTVVAEDLSLWARGMKLVILLIIKSDWCRFPCGLWIMWIMWIVDYK